MAASALSNGADEMVVVRLVEIDKALREAAAYRLARSQGITGEEYLALMVAAVAPDPTVEIEVAAWKAHRVLVERRVVA